MKGWCYTSVVSNAHIIVHMAWAKRSAWLSALHRSLHTWRIVLTHQCYAPVVVRGRGGHGTVQILRAVYLNALWKTIISKELEREITRPIWTSWFLALATHTELGRCAYEKVLKTHAVIETKSAMKWKLLLFRVYKLVHTIAHRCLVSVRHAAALQQASLIQKDAHNPVLNWWQKAGK